MIAPPLQARRPALPTSISSPALSSKTSRPQPMKRRSTLKRSIDETLSMDIPSSPSKRSRVTFDSDVEIVSADDDEELDPLVVKEQVRRGIERHRFQEDESYERVKNYFSTPPDKPNAPSTKLLKVHLQALLANVAALDKDCSGLISAVLHSEWVGRDENYYALFVRFLNNLAAAQRGYQHRIMSVLVDLLGPQKTRRIEGAAPVRQPKIHRRILQALRHITVNVPSSPAALAGRMASRLDFEFQKADERMTYVRNFMDMINYVPDLTSEILTCVMKELIKLDVSVQVDLDEEEDDAEDDILNHMSSSQILATTTSQGILRLDDQDDDMSTTDESEMDDDEDVDPAIARRRKLKEDIKQVDLIMDLLFHYYSRCTASATLQTRDAAIEQLISQFHAHILPTYRARHPQFLIFHFAQSDPIIVDRFVTSCVAVLVDKKQSHLLRHSAAAYFSGFVGRGAHVSPQVVQDCLDLLCDHLTILRRSYEATCRGPDLKRYGDFYAAFQAILYIFCFRWRDIASPHAGGDDDSDIDLDEDEVETYHFHESLRECLHAAIYSPLNPLRVCTPVIVEQFAKLAHALQLFYVYPKLEENRHVRVTTQLRGVSDLSISNPDRDLSWVGDNGMLEGYFPYDPYHLPISKHWIESDYVAWKGIPGDDADDSDSEDDGGMDVEGLDEDEVAQDHEVIGHDSDDDH